MLHPSICRVSNSWTRVEIQLILQSARKQPAIAVGMQDCWSKVHKKMWTHEVYLSPNEQKQWCINAYLILERTLSEPAPDLRSIRPTTLDLVFGIYRQRKYVWWNWNVCSLVLILSREIMSVKCCLLREVRIVHLMWMLMTEYGKIFILLKKICWNYHLIFD